jgi:16S rRNA (guanine527-N7)-methyltransferase
MDSARIAELLQPFLAASRSSPSPNDLSSRAELDRSQRERSGGVEGPAVLSFTHLQSISTYIDLLLRWNARINLTSVRDPEQIVTRHFGESLFAARAIFPRLPHASRISKGGDFNDQRPTTNDLHLIDIGSGAGFPGLPIKIWAPQIRLTVIESNNRKATFLREVTRTIRLTNVDVFAGRAEDFPHTETVNGSRTVTLRAVEHFEHILPVAAGLVPASGRLALLIGETQAGKVHELTRSFVWSQPVRVPLSSARVLMIGRNQHGHVPKI